MRELFFVISGLLITGLLIAEQKKAGSISLKGFPYDVRSEFFQRISCFWA